MFSLVINCLQLLILLKIAASDVRKKSIYLIDLVIYFSLVILDATIFSSISIPIVICLIIAFVALVNLENHNLIIGKGDLLLSISIILKLSSNSLIGLWLNLLAIICILHLIILLIANHGNAKKLRETSFPFAPHLISAMYLALFPTNF